MKTTIRIGLFALTLTVALVCVTSLSRAQMGLDEPRLIPYQGRLELDGQVVSGPHDFRFALFASELADASCLVQDAPTSCGVWWEEQGGIGVYTGAFSASLGASTALGDPVFAQPELFMAIAVRTSGAPAFTLLAGKKRVLPLPYAARAATANNFRITEDLFVGGGATVDGDLSAGGGATVDGDLSVGGAATVTGDLSAGKLSSLTYAPRYQSWSGSNAGDGEAAICNDNNSHQKLMVLGNSSATGGGRRRVGIWDDLTVNGAIHMTGSQGELGLRVIATEYASGGNTGAEAYKMSGAGTPECVRGRMYLGRPSGAGSQDGLCVCMNVDGSLDWWCFNP